MRCVRKVNYGNAALVPGLYFNIATRNRNQRTVMGNAVFRFTLGRRQFVIILEAQLTVFQAEDGVRAPLGRIVGTAACTKTAAPFVGEDYFAAIIGERCRMPIRVV